MFNFFWEIKKELKLPELSGEYNIVNLSGKALYVEGHKGLLALSEEKIMFKVKGKIVVVLGKDLKIKEMTKEILSLVGEIEKIEVAHYLFKKFWDTFDCFFIQTVCFIFLKTHFLYFFCFYIPRGYFLIHFVISLSN